ncbi:unnamed protein product [Miscanthus lutarioriparius]|uniref:RING-type E3 ubiquitin transferase n=1 Tax=Miscanthus lutarioriparius TaxID=422564 RepID=A0A811P011_9POAL|nr:unnamed protein product [Miscanthus lutarioriparius]
MSSPPPPVPDGGPSPFMQQQQPDYSFSGRVLLTAVIILAMLTVVFGLIRLLLYQFVARGRGSLALGVRRSFGSFGRRSARHGLDASALATLPVTTYRVRKADGGGGGGGDGSSSASGSAAGTTSAADCAVCLSELADGEKVRALPGCGHVFHVDCVDAWLRSRNTCPVCRAEVRPKATAGRTRAVAASGVDRCGGGDVGRDRGRRRRGDRGRAPHVRAGLRSTVRCRRAPSEMILMTSKLAYLWIRLKNSWCFMVTACNQR